MVEEEPIEAVAPIAAPPEPQLPLEINFHNGIAVRTAFLTAMVGSVLGQLPIPPQGLWLLLSLILAGFLAVFLYIRRTGQQMSIVAGARMGWITGVFSFAIATVFFTISIIAISSRGGFDSFYREILETRMGSGADVEKFLQMLQNPVGLGTILIMALVMLFVMFTIFPTLGGVLGAKVLARDRA